MSASRPDPGITGCAARSTPSPRLLERLLGGRGLRARYPAIARAYDTIFRPVPRRAVAVGVHGMKLFVDPHDHGIGQPLLRGGEYEPEETAFVRRVVRPGMVFVDLGANVGYYTCLAARLVGATGRVYAFEPDPDNFGLLRRSLRANRLDNVAAERAAISDASGRGVLQRSLLNHGAHRLLSVGGARLSRGVRTTTLDAALAGRETAVDFIKMDIEGWEPHALAGMERLLARSRDRVTILSELSPAAIHHSGRDPAAFLREFGERGFRLWSVTGFEVSPDDLLAAAGLDSYTNFVAAVSPR